MGYGLKSSFTITICPLEESRPKDYEECKEMHANADGCGLSNLYDRFVCVKWGLEFTVGL